MSRSEQKKKTNADIIDAAHALFARNGFAATSTADIAAACGVSHGTIFVHFKERGDLIIAVIDRFGEQLSKAFDHALAGEMSGADVLKAHLRTLAAFEDFYFRLLTELYALPANIQGTLFMLNAAVSCKLFDAASPQMKKGTFKKMSQPLLFNTWMALVSYYITHRELLETRKPILTHKEKELVDHFLKLTQP